MKEFIENLKTTGPPCIVPYYSIKKSKEPSAKYKYVPLLSRGNFSVKGWRKISSTDVCGIVHPPQAEPEIVSWTREEYELHLKDEQWTMEETENLFNLCRKFRLRFIIVQDRLEPTRSIEELKDRFYSVSRKLLKTRGLPFSQYEYNFAMDSERKKHLKRLMNRSEEEWQRDIRKHSLIRRFQLEWFPILEHARQSLLYSSSVSQRPTLPQLLVLEKEKRKYKKKIPLSIPKVSVVPSLPSSTASIPSAVSPSLVQKKDKRMNTLILRSGTVNISKNIQQQQRVQAQLTEFNLPHFPSMPTEQICNHFNVLLQSVIQLVDLKRQCERYENELKGLVPALGRRPSSLSDERKRVTPSVPSVQKDFKKQRL